MNNTIYFYSEREKPYGCFSNFSRHGFELDGKWWKTNEHYFQAQKFRKTDLQWYEKINQVITPKEAANMGRSRSHFLRSDWEKVKDNIMLTGVLNKFQTHQDIRQILLDTGDNLIVENSPIDYYWGCGKDRNGQNKLGLILMQAREILIKK